MLRVGPTDRAWRGSLSLDAGPTGRMDPQNAHGHSGTHFPQQSRDSSEYMRGGGCESKLV